MSKAVLHMDDTSVPATLTLLDKHGNVATPQTPPAWTVSADGVVTMTVAADGLSATFAPAGVGEITVDVVVDADPGDGVTELHASGQIQVLAAGIATAELGFGAVT